MKNKQGYKNTELGLIPEEWEVKEFGQLFYYVKSEPFSRDCLNYDKDDENIYNIHYGDIHTTYHNMILNLESDYEIPILKKEFHKSNFSFLKDGDLLIADVSEDYNGIGSCVELINVNNKKVTGGLHTIVAREKENYTEIGFRAYLMKSYTVTHKLKQIATGISVYSISKSNLSKLLIPIPPLTEQKKIAEILSTWDKAIENTEKQIEVKTQLKKGLMQKLLTGKIRFKEFENEKWSKVKIKKIAKQLITKNIDNLQIVVLSCSKHFGLVDSLKYFGKQIYSNDISTYKIVMKNQFAYATNHIEEGSIGYQNKYESALVSPMYTVFETNSEINNMFLYAILKTEEYRKIFESQTVGSINRRGGLRWNDFCNITIPKPVLKEQDKIANMLQTLDKELEIIKSQLIALKEQKKGLMQKLLTGEVRVKIEIDIQE